MKEIFRKLVCCSLLSIVSIGCFDSEARLPKYMAQKAAELLIEKSGLQLGDEAAKEALAKKLVDFLYSTEKRQLFANWMQAEYKKIIEFEKALTKLISDAKTQDYKVDTNTLWITPPSVSMKHFTQALIKRANTLKEKRENISDIATLNELFGYEFDIPKVGGYDFIKFTNQHFPCWTGTLTCFMLNKDNKAYTALLGNKIVDTCSESITDPKPAKKIVGILFTLELVDNWEDIKKITGTKKGAPDKTEDGYDPYDCVPVPNTMYKIDKSPKWTTLNTQGSCMVSTIRNLLYILCRDTQKSTQITTGAMRDNIQGECAGIDFCTVPGSTSCKTLGEFARKILPGISQQYQPTLDLFVCTLNSLLREELRESIPIPTPAQCISGSLGIPTTVIETILRKITNHSDLTVTHIATPTKVSSDWPESCLIIKDTTVNKIITIAFGRRGAGHHIEIINISTS